VGSQHALLNSIVDKAIGRFKEAEEQARSHGRELGAAVAAAPPKAA